MTDEEKVRRLTRERNRYRADMDGSRLRQREAVHEARIFALEHYGGRPPRCACCGETQPSFLTIDHIDGNGSRHRKEDNSAKDLARWLRKSGYPEGFRVLCFSCNSGRHLRGGDGTCPHEILQAVLGLFTDRNVRLVSLAEL